MGNSKKKLHNRFNSLSLLSQVSLAEESYGELPCKAGVQLERADFAIHNVCIPKIPA